MLWALHSRSNDPPNKVSELINNVARSWNREAIARHLQPADAHVILQIQLSSKNLEDEWAWHYERTGIFTVKLAHTLLIDTKVRR